MNKKISRELSNHRLEQSKQELSDAKLLLKIKSYKSANNRAYYSIFHAIKSVFALEPIDFKRHKDVQAYFNKNYVNTGIFPRRIGRKISIASKTREDSDYDDEFVVDEETTKQQIETAEELINLVEKYINEKSNRLLNEFDSYYLFLMHIQL